MNRISRRRFLSAGAAAGAALSMPFLSKRAFAADKVTILLNWYIYGEHAPIFYGREKGLFAANGIDLEIQEGRGSGITVQAVANKSAAFGYADLPTMIRAAVKGAPVVSPGVLLQRCPMAAMGFADRNMRKAADIKGKTVAITPGDSLSQIWPLFLKKAGLKESDVKIVSGDAQTKLNSVINGQADLLIGYAMDQSMRIKDATGKDVYPIMFADYGIRLVSSGVIAHADMLKENADLVRRFMDAMTKSVEGAEKEPKAAIDAILKANPKAGKPDTLLEGFRLTTQFYRTAETKSARPFRVTEANMTESVDVLIEYGGLEPAAKANTKTFYTNEFLPKQ